MQIILKGIKKMQEIKKKRNSQQLRHKPLLQAQLYEIEIYNKKYANLNKA